MNLKFDRKFIIGPYPPPIGGVSNYVYRFLKTHQSEGYKLVDYSKGGKLKKIFILVFLFLYPFKVECYVNHINKLVFAVLAFRFFKTRITFYDHNFRYLEQIYGRELWYYKSFLKRCLKIQIVNNQIVDYYLNYGIDIRDKCQLVIPFIPPILEGEQTAIATYPDEIKDFIKNHYPLVVANAFNISFYQSVDLYGVDLCLELINRLKTEYGNIGLLFGLASEDGNTDYYKDLLRFIEKNNLTTNIVFLTGQKELWPIIKRCDLFVRPTNTDGDALSIREALFFGKQVVASDVTVRPEGVNTFKNRDIDDFQLKVKSVLQLISNKS